MNKKFPWTEDLNKNFTEKLQQGIEPTSLRTRGGTRNHCATFGISGASSPFSIWSKFQYQEGGYSFQTVCILGETDTNMHFQYHLPEFIRNLNLSSILERNLLENRRKIEPGIDYVSRTRIMQDSVVILHKSHMQDRLCDGSTAHR